MSKIGQKSDAKIFPPLRFPRGYGYYHLLHIFNFAITGKITSDITLEKYKRNLLQEKDFLFVLIHVD
jgi:hypothetical protein